MRSPNASVYRLGNRNGFFPAIESLFFQLPEKQCCDATCTYMTAKFAGFSCPGSSLAASWDRADSGGWYGKISTFFKPILAEIPANRT